MLRVTALCLLALVALAAAQAPPFTCTHTSAAGDKYNLANMWRNPQKGQTDFAATYQPDGSTFNVNVCGQTITNKCPSDGVCQVTTQGVGYGNGDASKATWADYPGAVQGVSITYPSGSGASCPGGVIRKSVLNIKCDTSAAGDGVISTIAESTTPPCTYTISMSSKWACPGSAGPPPKPPKPPGSGGLSAGSIILIIVACLIPVYLVVGAVVKWKVYGAEPMSIDIIPNVDFWTALPFLVKDGTIYFIRKVSCNRVCGEYSEI